jgi:peptide/nickel transport system permease protein
MGWQPVILWADGLIWLTVSVVGLLFWRGADNMRAGWQSLWRQPVAMAAGLILLCYVGIGLLDSLHFRLRLPDQPGMSAQYSVEVNSVLDVLIGRLNAYPEQSYSAPLAKHLFVKMPTTLPDGHLALIYPDLALYHAQKLGRDEQGASRYGSVKMRMGLRGVLIGALLAAVITFLFAGWQAHRGGEALRDVLRTAMQGKHPLPWRTGWATLTVLCVVGAMMAEWSTVYHVLGTDKIGQDVLYQSMKGVRTGLMMGTLTTLVTLPLAVGLGIAAGYFGGWVDDVIQYIYTTLNSIPGVLLIVAAVLLMQGFIETHPALFDSAASRADFRLLFLCLILGVTSWTSLCRVLRGETLKLREQDYVSAARTLGVSDWRIMGRHVLPNLLHLILISMVMDFSGFVLAEAVLSYLGVGVDPAMASWGNMINAARLELSREPVVWWPLASAFGWMFVLVLSANLFADNVREAFDPLGRRR